MAKKKSPATTGAPAKKGGVKRNVPARSERIAKKCKVDTKLSKVSSLRFDVTVNFPQIIERYGVIADENDAGIILKTRPKSGSAKEGYLSIPASDLILVEGGKGEASRVLANGFGSNLYKGVAMKQEGNLVTLTDANGEVVTIRTGNGVTVSSVSFIDSKAKSSKPAKAEKPARKKKKKKDNDEDFD